MKRGVEQQAKQAAEAFRRKHRLGVHPLGDLVSIVARATGCDVAVLSSGPDEHGLTMRDPVRDAVFIGVARTRNPMRQRSTLAHELAHLLFKDCSDESEFTGERSPSEIRADAFARHLLAPTEGVRQLLGGCGTGSEAELSAVVQHYLVSPAVAAVVMREAGCIDAATAQKWMQYRTPYLATRYGWQDYYAALQADSDRLRAPQSLVAKAVAGYVEGLVSAQTIATLRSVDVSVVLEEFEEAGIVPQHPEASDLSPDELPEVDIDLSDLEDEDASS